jgi:amino acid adenylation domain-containing protein
MLKHSSSHPKQLPDDQEQAFHSEQQFPASSLLRPAPYFLVDTPNTERRPVHQWIETQVQKTPTAIAVADQNQSLTYDALNQKANQLAHYLRAQGVGPDCLVAVSLERSLSMVVAFLGILKAGGAYVPIDPGYPVARQRYLLQDCQAPLLLTQASLVETLPTQDLPVFCLDRDWSTLAQCPTTDLPNIATLDNLAYVIYTSGSTGNPKGVMIPHRGLINHCLAMVSAFELTPQDRVLQFSSISFDIIIEELYPALVSGAALVLRPSDIAQSIRAFLSFIDLEKITVLNLPTAFWHELVRGLSQNQSPITASLRLVIVGGEKASRTAYVQWRQLVGSQIRWLNTYGPTETTVSATLYDPIAAEFDPAQGELPIGKPLPNVKTYVLDDQWQPVPVGIPGELYIGGEGVARGYLNLPEKTADRFIADPFSGQPGAKLYRTGDRVRYRADGNLEFVGRIDFQVKIRGFRIELGEIETALETHPAVAQAVVIARENATGPQTLVAYVVFTDPQRADYEELQAFLGETLPAYMVPHDWVVMTALPLTPNGKVDRRALPAPTSTRAAAVVPPNTDLEARLVKIWQQILERSPIGITDNFFELGGHSLLVARLFDALERQFQRPLSLTIILEAPTIQQLAIALSDSIAENSSTEPIYQASTPVHLKSGNASPPLFLVHDADGDISPYLHLAHELKTPNPVYGIKPLGGAGYLMGQTQIPAMAAAYLTQIRTVQPQGPYLLGGLCAGGVIAFEMALQLQTQGETVAFVALLEAPDVEAVIQASQTTERWHSLVQSLEASLDPGLDQRLLSPRIKALWQMGKMLWQKGQNVVSYELRSHSQSLIDHLRIRCFRWYQHHQWSLPHWLQKIPVRKIYLLAEQDYIPQGKLHSPVFLFKATTGEGADQPYHEVYADPAFGWAARTSLPIEIYEIPGGHSTMLANPNVGILAKHLELAIQGALS